MIRTADGERTTDRHARVPRRLEHLPTGRRQGSIPVADDAPSCLFAGAWRACTHRSAAQRLWDQSFQVGSSRAASLRPRSREGWTRTRSRIAPITARR